MAQTGHHAPKTVRYYQVQLSGRARLTLRHDGMGAKKFLAWCAKNDFLDCSPLAEYEVHNAPRPAKHMPTGEEITRLLQDYWNPEGRPGASRTSNNARPKFSYMCRPTPVVP
jgi:hypothetical protein